MSIEHPSKTAKCQAPRCMLKQNPNQSATYCVDCQIALCSGCLNQHAMDHCFIENVDIKNLQEQSTFKRNKQPETATKSNGQHTNGCSKNGFSVSKSENLNGIVRFNLMDQFALMEGNSSSIIMKKNAHTIKIPFSNSDTDSDDEDDMMLLQDITSKGGVIDLKTNSRIAAFDFNCKIQNETNHNKSILLQNNNMNGCSYNIYQSSDSESSSNSLSPSELVNNNNHISINNCHNTFLQVPKSTLTLSFDKVKQQLLQRSSSLTSFKPINYQASEWMQSFKQPLEGEMNMSPALTPIQELLQPNNRHSDLLERLLTTVKPQRNKIIEKFSTINFISKKKRLGNQKNGEERDNSSCNFEDIPIPEKKFKETLPTQLDNKQIIQLKTKAKEVFEQLKQTSDRIFEDAKDQIHGAQYERDEMDRINKYKKYALEGVEQYFRNLKDQFTSEYEKLKKCKKREKLSRMMNKIVKSADSFQYLSEPKDFAAFLSKDYSLYFEMIQDQLNEIAQDGKETPPQFVIVYENLYDIFDSLLSYISLHLPSKKEFASSTTQPLILQENSTHSLIAFHSPLVRIPHKAKTLLNINPFSLFNLYFLTYLSIFLQKFQKNKIILWNSQTYELTEFSYEKSENPNDFSKFRNFQIISDSEYIYFIGGQIYNIERNTFVPSDKSFKMNVSNGQIIPLRDMPQAKMKFGMTLVNNYIYTFGGLCTSEKYRTNTCEFYDISSNNWKQLPSMNRNRVSPLVCPFVGVDNISMIYLLGGMEDKNNISQAVDCYDIHLNQWMQSIEKPMNHKCYIPKQLGYAIQINQEQILLIGGMSGRKQKPTTSMQTYNVSKKSISNLSLDSLPQGIIQDFHASQPVIFNKAIYLVNSQVSQYFPVLKQLEGVCNIFKIGLNQQQIISTYCV